MADRGLGLIRPPFLRQRTQLEREEGLESANISAARIHVERTISRFKLFDILTKPLKWEILPYMNDIATVCAASVNLSPPVLKDDKF